MKKRKPQTLSKFAQRYKAERQPKPQPQPLAFTRSQWKELDEAYHQGFPQAPKLNLP